MEKVLGKIKAVNLHIEDHGILTLDVRFDFGGSGQVMGGYSFGSQGAKRKHSGYGIDYILRLLTLFEVDSLDKIVGRVAYALRKSDRHNEKIIGIQTTDFEGCKTFLIEELQRDWVDKS